MLVALYSAPKVLRLGNTVGKPCYPTGGLVAGCSCATGLARVLLTQALDRAQKISPHLHITNVIDDMSLQVVGEE
eukprot:12881364-Prorocentrum_lima.AAC.1